MREGSHLGKILIVDDHEEFRFILKRALGDLGYMIELARDGQEALEMILAPPTQLWLTLITDHHMPKLTGIELIRKLGKTDIFFGGIILHSSMLSDDETLLRLKANWESSIPVDFLPKPASCRDLKFLIEQAETRFRYELRVRPAAHTAV